MILGRMLKYSETYHETVKWELNKNISSINIFIPGK